MHFSMLLRWWCLNILGVDMPITPRIQAHFICLFGMVKGGIIHD